MRRHALYPFDLVVVASVAVLAVLALRAPSAAASPNGHLYAVVGQWNVQRFPLFGGIPSHNPDLTIQSHGPVLAVRGDGTVAAQLNSGNKVDFFAPGQTKP